MKQWALDQLGKWPGEYKIAKHIIIFDVDKFINSQLATMETYKPKTIMFNSAYRHLYEFKQFTEQYHKDG